VTELEEELSGLRDRIAAARAPADGRLDQLEHAIESERRLLQVARFQLLRRSAGSGVLGLPFLFVMFITVLFLLRAC
jgi:hypothetical protein